LWPITRHRCRVSFRRKTLYDFVSVLIYKQACIGHGDIGFRPIVNRKPFEKTKYVPETHWINHSPRAKADIREAEKIVLGEGRENEFWSFFADKMGCFRMTVALLWTEGIEFLYRDPKFFGFMS
jgi:hypothetical protein